MLYSALPNPTKMEDEFDVRDPVGIKWVQNNRGLSRRFEMRRFDLKPLYTAEMYETDAHIEWE